MAMEIFTVGRGQEGYPERLMPFADMPSRLFVRGALPADEQKTATRRRTRGHCAERERRLPCLAAAWISAIRNRITR